MYARTAFLVTLVLGWILGACDKEEIEAEPILRPVRTVVVGSTTAGRQRTFSGTAQAGTESRLSFKVPGTIKQLAVKVGDRVKKGQLIAELDARDYDLQVAQAQASEAQAQAQLRNAEAAFKRTRDLYANRSASKGELDAARAGADTAKAALHAASKQVQLLRQQRAYTRLKAPMDGSIAECKAEVNENVQAGQVVAILAAGKDIEVRVAVPEIMISRIEKGKRARVRFDALPGKSFLGTVDEVGVSSLKGGSTYPVTIRLVKPDPEIRAGMAAEVDFEFGRTKDPRRVIVPSVAVGEDRNGRHVFVVEEVEPGIGVVRRRAVEVGELATEGLEVTSGLGDGDVVVTAGVSFLEDGRRVRIPSTTEED